MKRTLALALTLVMLFAAFSPVLAAEQTPPDITPVDLPDMSTVSAETLERGLNSKTADREALRVTYEGEPGQLHDNGAKRAVQNNLLVPSPLMYGQASFQGYFSMTLQCIAYEYGRSDQSYAVMIYKGTDLNRDPIGTTIGKFSATTGMREVHIRWDYDMDIALGTYTVVTCTVTGSGSNYQAVSDTAYAEAVYIVPYEPDKYALKSVWFEDAETGKRVNSLKLGLGESKVLIAHRVPEITTNVDSLPLSADGGLMVENYNGMYIISAKDICGWFSCFNPPWSDYQYGLDSAEVCWYSGGHSTQTVHLRDAMQTVTGADAEYCPICGAARILGSDTLEKAFTKFTDLQKNAWYYPAVQTAVYDGLFSGVSATKFDPNGAMTRAMLVSVLWRYAGKPECGTSTFSDVPEGKWYTNGITWAAENNIVSGTGNGKFKPDGIVTREQVASILQRFAAFMGEEIKEGEELTGFEDPELVSGWALDAVKWAVSEKLISGVAKNDLLYLQPQGSASRAQVASILTRFLESFRAPEPATEELDLTGAEAHDTNLGSEWAFYPDGTLVVKTSAQLYWSGQLTEAPWAKYTDRITSVKVLNTVTMIGNGCFHDLPKLESAELPESVTEIGMYAFSGCTALKEIRLPSKLQIIDNFAFSSCTALEKIELPRTLMNIGSYCFKDCTSLKEIEIPDSVAYAEGFDRSDRAAVESYAFSGCTALQSVRLPTGLLEIPEGLFQGCTSLEDIELPLTVQEIRQDAFYGCSIDLAILPLSVSRIHDNALRGISGLQEVWVLNPLAKCPNIWDSASGPVYEEIFGDPATVTVYGWEGSEVERAAKKTGYAFVALDTLTEEDLP